MSSRDTTVATRNARWVMVQRGSQIAGAVLFALIVPRWMGPDEFGRYALVTSISMSFALLSSMGAVSMMTRAVPGFVLRQDLAGLRTLVSGLTGLRAGVGLLAAALYVALTMIWLRDIDVIGLLFIAGAVFSRPVGNMLLALMLGLNQAARWALGETLRRWLTFVLVVAGYNAWGFRGACLGYFAAHAAALVFGVWTARAYVDWRALVPKLEFLAPHLRTGASFAVGNILLALSQRTGETLVHLSTGRFAEVGYFGVAYGVYVAAGQALWHFAVSFAPMLVGWKEQGDVPAIRDWISRFAFRLIAGAVVLAVLMVLVGPIAVGLVLGSEVHVSGGESPSAGDRDGGVDSGKHQSAPRAGGGSTGRGGNRRGTGTRSILGCGCDPRSGVWQLRSRAGRTCRRDGERGVRHLAPEKRIVGAVRHDFGIRSVSGRRSEPAAQALTSS